MDEFVKRIVVEKNELDEKLGKLNGFLVTEKFKTLEVEMQDLMSKQAKAMTEYSEILGKRLTLLN